MPCISFSLFSIFLSLHVFVWMFRHLGLALCFLDILFIFFAFIGLFVGVCVFVFVPVFLSYILRGKGFLWIQHEYTKLFERTRLFAPLTSSSVCWSQCFYMCARVCLRLCLCGKGFAKTVWTPRAPSVPARWWGVRQTDGLAILDIF